MQTVIKGSPVFYEEYGSGTPLVCLHGFPEDHRAVAGSVEASGAHLDGLRRIYPDLPGMGRSPANPAVQGADDMLEVVRLFIEAAASGAECLLLGQSYGGYLSLGLAHTAPQCVAGLFLLCPCVVSASRARTLPERRASAWPDIGLQPGDSVEDYADFKDYTAVVNERTWARYKAEVLPGLKVADENFVQRYQSGGGYGFSFEAEMLRMAYDGPSCFLIGGQDDCVGYEDAWRVSRGFGRAAFTLVEGAGHNLQLEKPEWFNFCLGEWLARADGFGEAP